MRKPGFDENAFLRDYRALAIQGGEELGGKKGDDADCLKVWITSLKAFLNASGRRLPGPRDYEGMMLASIEFCSHLEKTAAEREHPPS